MAAVYNRRSGGLDRTVNDDVRWFLIAAFALMAGIAPADRFDDFIKAKMEEERIPALQFVVTYKGRVAMSRAYGFADLDKKTPAATTTPFEIASVSKPVVATAVMMLWEQGKFKLEDPIGKYVSEIPLAWSRVPIRNLMSHTSGVPEYRGGPVYAKRRMEEVPFADIVKGMSTELEFDVDDHFAYSNTNYLLLGKLIEALTGKPYVEFVKAQILDPLGMSQSGFVGTLAHAQGYTALAHEQMANRDCSLAWAGPGGCLVSTAEDLAKFDAALDAQRLIKNATLLQMLQPTVTRLGTMDYGLGWQVAKINGSVVSLHQGKMNGFASMYLRLLSERISVIVLANASDIDGNGIARGILGLYFPEMDPKILTPIVDDDPKTTAAHQAIVRSILAGKPDMDAFTDDYKAHVSEEKLRAMGAELRRGGPVKPFQVIRRYRKGSLDAHQYLMTQGQTQFLVAFFVEEGGKIAGLTIGAP